jgi:hypothetical protein
MLQSNNKKTAYNGTKTGNRSREDPEISPHYYSTWLSIKVLKTYVGGIIGCEGPLDGGMGSMSVKMTLE